MIGSRGLKTRHDFGNVFIYVEVIRATFPPGLIKTGVVREIAARNSDVVIGRRRHTNTVIHIEEVVLIELDLCIRVNAEVIIEAVVRLHVDPLDCIEPLRSTGQGGADKDGLGTNVPIPETDKLQQETGHRVRVRGKPAGFHQDGVRAGVVDREVLGGLIIGAKVNVRGPKNVAVDGYGHIGARDLHRFGLGLGRLHRLALVERGVTGGISCDLQLRLGCGQAGNVHCQTRKHDQNDHEEQVQHRDGAVFIAAAFAGEFDECLEFHGPHASAAC